MGNYYYAVSSFPYLDFDTEPVITMHKFLEICESTLTEKDFKIIESVYLSEFDRMDDFVCSIKKWVSWEYSLRNELVRLRSAILGFESERYIRDVELNTEAVGVAQNAFKLDSALASEEVIDRAKWGFLDELEVNHYFDLDKIVVYTLKLKILERKKMFKIENGDKNFKIIYENIKEAVRET